MITSPLLARQEFDRDKALKTKKSVENKDRFFEFLDYEQKVYSSSTGGELGEQTSFSAAVRFIPDDNAFVRMRLNVDPKKNVFENQTQYRYYQYAARQQNHDDRLHALHVS